MSGPRDRGELGKPSDPSDPSDLSDPGNPGNPGNPGDPGDPERDDDDLPEGRDELPSDEGDFPAEGDLDGDLPSDDEAERAPSSVDEPPAEGELDEVDIRELLRSALAEPPPPPERTLLVGVQRKIRRRSRGRFYNDGWSTSRSPRSTYLVTSALMLVLLLLVFFVLVPLGGQSLP